MKKLTALCCCAAFVMMSVCMTSCKKDNANPSEDPTPTPTPSLANSTWVGHATIDSISTTMVFYFNSANTFRAANNISNTEVETLEGTYTFDGTKAIFSVAGHEVGTGTIAGNSMTMTEDGVTITFKRESSNAPSDLTGSLYTYGIPMMADVKFNFLSQSQVSYTIEISLPPLAGTPICDTTSYEYDGLAINFPLDLGIPGVPPIASAEGIAYGNTIEVFAGLPIPGFSSIKLEKL